MVLKFILAPLVVSICLAEHVGPVRLYPDPALTPGAAMTKSAKVVCVPGYAKRARRPLSFADYRKLLHEYRIHPPFRKGEYEDDHLIPLELGGSNALENRWMEPAEPRPGYHEKDAVENYLHRKVCSGHMALPEAQRLIVEDWYAVWLQMRGAK